MPENIGAAARAIKTMGFRQLRIVDSDQHLAKKAQILAHGATEILQTAKTYEDLGSAIEDVDWVIGTSAKRRLGKRFSHDVNKLEIMLGDKKESLSSVAIVFGCEESGLSNADLQCCDALSYIPIAQKYPSLNLGQAVMLFAYNLRGLAILEEGRAKEIVDNESVSNESFLFLKNKVSDLLSSLDLNKDEKLYRWSMERLAVLADTDIKFLHLFLRRLKEKSKSGEN